MFPHRTASATKLRPRTGPKYRSGKRPLLPFRTLLLAALLLSGIRCALAQPRIGIAYCDLDHLYDTIPALFYDDSDYTPGGRLAWDTERYRRKIARTAAVIDSMRMAARRAVERRKRSGRARHRGGLPGRLQLPALHA